MSPYSAPYPNAIGRVCPCVFGHTNTTIPTIMSIRTIIQIRRRVSVPIYADKPVVYIFFAMTPIRRLSIAIKLSKQMINFIAIGMIVYDNE